MKTRTPRRESRCRRRPRGRAGECSARRAPLATGPDVVHLEFQDHRLFHDLLGHQDEHLKVVERDARRADRRRREDALDQRRPGRARARGPRVRRSSTACSSAATRSTRATSTTRIRILASDHNAQPPRHLPRHDLHLGAEARRSRRRAWRRRPTSTRSATTTSCSAIGPAGTGKTYLAMAMAVAAAAEAGVHPHHPHASRGRGRREARLPARRSRREGQSVSPAALRRAPRHGRLRPRPEDARARHDRGGAARVHARPHAERLVRHPRRGAEHDAASR